MEFWLLTIATLLLAATSFLGAGRLARNFLFYLFWFPGLVAVGAALFLYFSVPLFDQDLMFFPYFKIALIIGLISLLLSHIAAIFGGRSSIYSQLAEERQQRAISEITQVAVSSTSLMELLNFTLDKIVAMLGMAAGTVHIFHRARQNLVLGSYKGLSARLARRLETIELGETAIGRTARNKRLLIIRNLRLSPDYEMLGGKTDGFSYMTLIPIISEGEHWGVITLFGKGSYRSGLLQVDLLEQFGEQVGSALVLGRHMRATQASLESMKSLIGSLGDELYAGSKLSESGPGAVRGIAWSLSRILSGDRFDLCRKTASEWITVLSSEPKADGLPLTYDPQSGFDDDSRLSGMIGWDQIPPFKEFMERRPYIFCSMPDKETWMFIRLESRRRATFDFNFFYDACRIIYGLYHIVAQKELRGPVSPAKAVEPMIYESADSGASGGVTERISGTFDKISHDLEKLIEEYSPGDSKGEMQGLIGWLEVIRKSVIEGKGILESTVALPREEPPAMDNLDSIIDREIDRVSDSGKKLPEIRYANTGRVLSIKYPVETFSQVVGRFLDLASGAGEGNRTLTLTSDRNGQAVVLKLVGESLPALGGQKPKWLADIDGRLEFSSEINEDGVSLDSWRLVIPEKAETEEKIAVLAVDTRDIIRDLLAGMLSQLGFEPVIVDSSREAIRLFEQGIASGQKFDIVIADNSIDELSGLELASRMKATDPDIFFLLTPGWGMEPDQAQVTKSGVDMVLEKPFRIEQLSDAIERSGKKATGA